MYIKFLAFTEKASLLNNFEFIIWIKSWISGKKKFYLKQNFQILYEYFLNRKTLTTCTGAACVGIIEVKAFSVQPFTEFEGGINEI